MCDTSLQCIDLFMFEKYVVKGVYKSYKCYLDNVNNTIKAVINAGGNINDDITSKLGNTFEIVSIIWYAISQGKSFSIYKLSKQDVINAAKSESEYNKIYDKIIEQTQNANKNFYNRAVKVANHILLKYLEDTKEKTESDLRREKIELKKKMQNETIKCPECGAKNNIVDLYCLDCGARLKK